MKFSSIVLLAVGSIFGQAAITVTATRDDIAFLMYETDAKLEHDPLQPLHFFKERSEVAGVQTTVYGGGLAYHGFGDKYQTLRPILEEMDDHTLVVLADARDVVLNVPENEKFAKMAIDNFITTFHRLTKDYPNAIVMSGEAQCCVSAMAHAHPSEYFDKETGKRNKRACPSGHPSCRWENNQNVEDWQVFQEDISFNRTGEEFADVYLNAGLMAAYAKDMIKLLDVMDIAPYEDDQALLAGLMYSFPEMIVMDYQQEMFGNNQWTRGLVDGCVFETQGKHLPLIHAETNTEPLFLHTPGKFYDCLDILIEELGGASQQRYLFSKTFFTSMSDERFDAPSPESRISSDESTISIDEGETYGEYDNYSPYGNYGYGNYYGGYGNYGYGNSNYGYGSNYAYGSNYGLARRHLQIPAITDSSDAEDTVAEVVKFLEDVLGVKIQYTLGGPDSAAEAESSYGGYGEYSNYGYGSNYGSNYGSSYGSNYGSNYGSTRRSRRLQMPEITDSSDAEETVAEVVNFLEDVLGVEIQYSIEGLDGVAAAESSYGGYGGYGAYGGYGEYSNYGYGSNYGSARRRRRLQATSIFDEALTNLEAVLGIKCSVQQTAAAAAESNYGYGGYGSNYGAYGSNYGAYGSNYGAYGSNYGAYGSNYGAYGSNYGAYGSNYGSYGSYGSNYGNGNYDGQYSNYGPARRRLQMPVFDTTVADSELVPEVVAWLNNFAPAGVEFQCQRSTRRRLFLRARSIVNNAREAISNVIGKLEEALGINVDWSFGNSVPSDEAVTDGANYGNYGSYGNYGYGNYGYGNYGYGNYGYGNYGYGNYGYGNYGQ